MLNYPVDTVILKPCPRSGFRRRLLVRRGGATLELGGAAADLENFPDPPALRAVHDVTNATRRAAATGVILPKRVAVSIIKRQLLACRDVASGQDPDFTLAGFSAAIGRARVIDEPGDVAARAAVKVVTLIQLEDINGAITSPPGAFQPPRLAPPGLGLGDFLAHIFDDTSSIRNITARIHAAAMNGGVSRVYPGIGLGAARLGARGRLTNVRR